MEYPNFDGECHAIPGSKDYGYVAHRVGVEIKEVQDKIELEIGKYAEYLYAHDKEEVLRILTDVMRAQVMHGYTLDNYQIIHRPPWIVSALAQYGTIVLKFKRSKKDNLDEGYQSCSRCC